MSLAARHALRGDQAVHDLDVVDPRDRARRVRRLHRGDPRLRLLASASSGSLPGNAPQIPADGLPAMLYSTATAVGYVFPLLIGTLMVTTEFRHKTLTPTFLATPKRGVVLWAKILVGIVVGVLFGVLGVLSSVVPAAGLPGRATASTPTSPRSTPGRCSAG